MLGPASSLKLVLYIVEMDETRGVTRLSRHARLIIQQSQPDLKYLKVTPDEKTTERTIDDY